MPIKQKDFSTVATVRRVFDRFFERASFSVFSFSVKINLSNIAPPLLGVKISKKDAGRCVIPINTSPKFSQGGSTEAGWRVKSVSQSSRAGFLPPKLLLTYFLRRFPTKTGSNWVAGNRSGLCDKSQIKFFFNGSDVSQ